MNTSTQEITVQPYHGIFLNDGRKFSNWGSSRSTQPAVYVEPISYADVQAIVRNTEQFPTPVRPVGSMLSVTEIVVNDGGNCYAHANWMQYWAWKPMIRAGMWSGCKRDAG